MAAPSGSGPSSPFESPTFEKDVSIFVNDSIGAASISPSGRDVVLASKNGLLIIDLDSPYSPPRQIVNRTEWEVADVQWSPFACRADWIASTCNQKALIYNLSMPTGPSKAPIQHVLHAHDRAITDINFSAHHPDLLATCAVDSYVFTWDLRGNSKPVMKFADFDAGATQVKWNRADEHVIASSHDRLLRIWDTRFGAIPVATINAHSTKIYGIDWDRADRSKIITCSLDHTIKLWDCSKSAQSELNPRDRYKYIIETPEQIIKTPFPVWRARHTPFAHGILALPQRGSSALHLYDLRKRESEPAHRFHAHEETARVREFLWRTRGIVEDGIDNREFQLVSWGSDMHLHLYRIKHEVLTAAIGHKRGYPVEGKPSMTRWGAPYVTYREEPARTTKTDKKPEPATAPVGTLSSLLQQASTTAVGLTLQDREERVTMTAPQGRNMPRKVVNHIKWMEGVKVGERVTDANGKWVPSPSLGGSGTYPWSDKDDLASEVRAVGTKYKRVDFEKVNHTERRITVSLNRPCGPEEKLAFLRITIQFPPAYPRAAFTSNEDGGMTKTLSPPEFELEKTTAAVSQDILDGIKADLQILVNHYAASERHCLDAMIRFLLGERLDSSMTLEPEVDEIPGIIPPADGEETSEDDEDDEEDEDVGMEMSIIAPINVGANVPISKTCSATFSASGILSMTSIPREEPPSRFVNISRGLEIFETFGRLRARSPSRDDKSALDGDASDDADDEHWVSSSSSSSDASSESDDIGGLPRGKFQPPLAWQKATLRFQNKTSHPSSVSARPPKTKSSVHILRSVEEFIPSKRALAEEYEIFGDGPKVCEHNAKVARKRGYEDLATVWDFCRIILNNDIPLEVLPQQRRRDQILVLARRAIVRIKRKDSGLDLRFDEPDSITNSKLKGRVKWGHHPVVAWLIPALFDHFEKLADTQMLAMLSCIFSEPAAFEGASAAVNKRKDLPTMAVEAPAFSLDYFPSADAAWSLYKPTITIPTTPAHSRYATPVTEFGPGKFSKTFDTYGSQGSSNGPWGSDMMNSEPMTPYSTGNTPPTISRIPTLRSLVSHTPFSTSPEQHQTLKRSATSNLASAIATLSRPFANVGSSSPPVKTHTEGDLSTSAPTSGVTWGSTTFISGSSTAGHVTPQRTKHGKRASFGQGERINIDYISDSDSDLDEPFPDGSSEYTVPGVDASDGGGEVRVILKNQDQFDDEACVSAPLLDSKKESLYRRWREQYADMLGIWGLVTKRAEVLKFNGLVSYFPSEGKTSGPPQLGLKAAGVETPPATTSMHLSRSSTLLVPSLPGQRSQANSPRHFSFNPEALEFKPGSSLLNANNAPLVSPQLPFVPALDTYLSLSILPPSEPTSILASPDRGRPKLKPRPSASTAANSRAQSKNRDSLTKWEKEYQEHLEKEKKRKVDLAKVHSCSICWIRIRGRFYLCAACGHVAHFDCVEAQSDIRGERRERNKQAYSDGSSPAHPEFDECVVGCGCPCAEEAEEQTYWETPWDERGAWLDAHYPHHMHQMNPNGTSGAGGGGESFGAGGNGWFGGGPNYFEPAYGYTPSYTPGEYGGDSTGMRSPEMSGSGYFGDVTGLMMMMTTSPERTKETGGRKAKGKKRRE